MILQSYLLVFLRLNFIFFKADKAHFRLFFLGHKLTVVACLEVDVVFKCMDPLSMTNAEWNDLMPRIGTASLNLSFKKSLSTLHSWDDTKVVGIPILLLAQV